MDGLENVPWNLGQGHDLLQDSTFGAAAWHSINDRTGFVLAHGKPTGFTTSWPLRAVPQTRIWELASSM